MTSPAPTTTQQTPHTETSGTLEELIKKNIAWSEAIHKQNEQINKKLRWMSIMSSLRLLIILVPIILGIIYLPPLLADAWDQYQAVLGIGGGGDNSTLINQLLEQYSNR